MTARSQSAINYGKNAASRKKKNSTTAKKNKEPGQIAKRVESNGQRRRAKAAGRNIKGKDFDHDTGTFIASSVNRGKPHKNGRKKKTARKRV